MQQVYADGILVDGKSLDLANNAQRMLLKAAILASDATDVDGVCIGDPTEIACAAWGRVWRGGGFLPQPHPALGQRWPSDSDRKLMSTLHNIEGHSTLLTKGAIDVLLARSNRILTHDGVCPMTEEDRQRISQVNAQLSENGLRVLTFAYREMESERAPTVEDEKDFTFIGLISMMDPPRPESVKAVADAKRAGIRTVMITGDHKVTARAIARQIGIFEEGDMALDGVELDGMTDQQLDEVLPEGMCVRPGIARA